MIFPRSIPPRQSKNYHDYRPYLRKDFLNRCAYCLRHEVHFGGEANAQIDHFFPEAEFKKINRLDYGYAYNNLFWSCGECNNLKWDSWPSAEEEALGLHFVNSSREDTDEHWEVSETGEIHGLTQAGRYTIDTIFLGRDDLVRWRREIMEAVKRIERLKMKISNPTLTSEDKNEFHSSLQRDLLFVHPHPFDRPARKAKQS